MAGPAVKETLHLLHLDRHHLGDELFLNELAQRYASSSETPATVIVHGSGEKVERTLEAEGYFPERSDGLLEVETDAQRRLVERAVREVNQEIVAALTDEVVSTVGIQGMDRGLLQEDEDGALRAVNTGWVSSLIKQHVVPVVSSLVQSGETGKVHEVRTAEATLALARAFDETFDPVACLFTTQDAPGLTGGDGEVLDEVSVEDVADDQMPDLPALRTLSGSEVPVMVTNLGGLFSEEDVRGTHVEA